jgi:hypothetical protein
MLFHLSTSVGCVSGDAPSATTTATNAVAVAAATANQVRLNRLIVPLRFRPPEGFAGTVLLLDL